MIEFRCPHCQRLLTTDQDKAGYIAKCPSCAQQIDVPRNSESPTTRSEAPSPSPAKTAQVESTSDVWRISVSKVVAGDVLQKAWDIYKSQLRVCVVVSLTLYVTCAVSMLPFLILGGLIDEGAFGGGEMNGIMTLVALLLLVASLGIDAWALTCFHDYAVKIVRNREIKISELFGNLKYFWRVVLLSLALGTALAIGVYLFVIPGIVVAVVSWPCFFLVIDRQLGAMSAARAALRIARHNWVASALLMLAGLGIQLVGIVACGVGLIATTPLSMLIFATAYLMMTESDAVAESS